MKSFWEAFRGNFATLSISEELYVASSWLRLKTTRTVASSFNDTQKGIKTDGFHSTSIAQQGSKYSDGEHLEIWLRARKVAEATSLSIT